MAKLPDSRQTEPKALSVEQLLRFKKAECPNEAFWEDFDRKLHQRLFQSVVERRPSGVRHWFSVVLHSRSTYAMPVLAAVMVAVGMALSRSAPAGLSPVVVSSGAVDMVVSVEAPARSAVSSGRERFVVDGMNMDTTNGQFRKVMASQAMKLTSTDSTRYVADQLGASGRSGVLYASNTF